jgi:hypothetical protein
VPRFGRCRRTVTTLCTPGSMQALRIPRLKNVDVCGIEAVELLGVALIDPRATNEDSSHTSTATSFLDVVAEVGAEATKLAMLDHACEVVGTRSAGKQNPRLQAHRQFEVAGDIARATCADSLVTRPPHAGDALARRVTGEVGQRIAGALMSTGHDSNLRAWETAQTRGVA